MAAVSEAIEQCRRHLGVSEDGGPFAEAEVRRDDDAGSLVELAQQVEQQRPAGGAERQVAKLIEDDEIGMNEPRCDLPGLALVLFRFERVDEFDGGEEPDALAVMLNSLDANRCGQMRLARARQDRDMAPDFWRVKRRSTTPSILWRGRPWRRPVGASCTSASNTSRFA